MAELDSSAPHLANASTRNDVVPWGVQPDAIAGISHSSGRVLFKGPDNQPECGLWICTPGRWRLSIPRDELCYFVAGRADYRRDNGERIEVTPGTLVMFLGGWAGECTVHETMRNTYMLTAGGPAPGEESAPIATPSLCDPLSQTNLVDWGVIPTMLEGASHTSGKLLFKGPQGCSVMAPVLRVADLELNRDTREVRRDGEVVELTPKEFAVLEYLMRHAGRVMSRTLITEYAWGYHFDPGTNIVDVVINHLRKKIDARYPRKLITTVRGVGYVVK